MDTNQASEQDRKRRRRLSVSHVTNDTPSTPESKSGSPVSGKFECPDRRGYVKQGSTDEAGASAIEETLNRPSSARPIASNQDRASTVPISPKAPERPARNTRRLSVSGRISVSGTQSEFSEKEVSVKSSSTTTFNKLQDLVPLGVAYACHKGLKPESPNQDDFFVIKIDDWGLYGVFDGHGPHGHDISNFVQREFPKTLYCPDFLEAQSCQMKKLFEDAFDDVERKLEDHCSARQSMYDNTKPDCHLSGTTGSVVYHRLKNKKLFVAHVGDSRVVLARKTPSGFIAIDLTDDHKPQNPPEQARIEACGGEVVQMPGDVPHRVFRKGQHFPGLAMSRAFGDLVGRTVGVISVPDVRDYDIVSDDEFIILASDGVWEFISSQDCVDMIAKYPREQVALACEAVCQEAWQRWVDEEETIVDDITLQIIYLRE